ncbi:unnamed protein product [Calicophoron daubneyi]|uniref:Uncharacterized protein n=1 Tax=Calicophoron daubneyi TaxID=300641 RepID=A0AAV2T7K2_CALDB
MTTRMNQKTLSSYFGHPAQFGPHAMLPHAYFRILWSLLRCTKCEFRTLYHQIITREYKRAKSKKAAGSFVSFHSLSVAIKAILRGFRLNKDRLGRVIVKSTGHASVYNSSASVGDYTAVIHTALCLQVQYAVCPSHGRELFSRLYFCEKTAAPCEDGPLFSKIIPGGQSTFFRAVQTSKLNGNHKKTDDGRVPRKAGLRRLQIIALGTPGDAEKKVWHFSESSTNPTPDKEDGQISSLLVQRIADANKRWEECYGVSLLDENSQTHATQRSSKFLRFPSGNPVSAVHHLVVYATACQLERQDRVWELSARHRIFDRYRELICKGYDPISAAELAERDIEDLSPTASANAVPNPCKTNSDLSKSGSVSKSQKKRRRRRKNHCAGKNVSCSELNESSLWPKTSSNLCTPLCFSTTIHCLTGEALPIQKPYPCFCK